MQNTVLIAHTDNDISEKLAEMAQLLGLHSVVKSCGREIFDYMVVAASHRPDVIVMASDLNDKTPMDLIHMIRRTGECIPVIIYANSPDDKDALLALRAGAEDFIYPPMTLARFRVTLFNALENKEMKKQMLKHACYGDEVSVTKDIIGSSANMDELRRFVAEAGKQSGHVALVGEAGVGKTMCARIIHALSHPPEAPFLVVKASPFPQKQTSIASTLAPAIEAAQGGTLYINNAEILSHEEQLYLADALDRQQGSSSVRVIISCHAPLKYLYVHDTFCNDFYALFSQHHFEIEPLRKRAEDIPLLVHHYAGKICLEEHLPPCPLDTDRVSRLKLLPWMGNVRELLFVLRRSLILQDMMLFEAWGSDNTVHHRDADCNISREVWSFPEPSQKKRKTISLFKNDGTMKCIDDLEAETIAYALEHYNGCMSEVARRLGIGRSTLYRKVNDYNISNAA